MWMPNKNGAECLAESESLGETLKHAFRHVYAFILQAVKGDKATPICSFRVIRRTINLAATWIAMRGHVCHARGLVRQTGDVAARSRQTRDQAGPDRVRH
jgi:hypothetical protein